MELNLYRLLLSDIFTVWSIISFRSIMILSSLIKKAFVKSEILRWYVKK